MAKSSGMEAADAERFRLLENGATALNQGPTETGEGSERGVPRPPLFLT